MPLPPSPYSAQAELAAALLGDSIRYHFQSVVESGLLGAEPSERLLAAAWFEVGCLNLYLLDHELRRGRRKDPLLNEFWSGIALDLQQPYRGLVDDQGLANITGWRMGRYEDVSAPVEADTTYPEAYPTARLHDYFYVLAEQFTRCLAADEKMSGENGIYLGVVNTENIPLIDSKAEIIETVLVSRQTLLRCALPLYLTAKKWGQGTPFYEKSAEELEALAREGAQEAYDWQAKAEEDALLAYSCKRWLEFYTAEMRFVLVPQSDSPEPQATRAAQSVRRDERGHRYLWVRPDSNGAPIGRVLLLARDVTSGIATWDPSARGDDATPLLLPLGMMEHMLHWGKHSDFQQRPGPDMTDPDALRFGPADCWNLSGAARWAIDDLYRETGPAAPEPPLAVHVSQVADATGATALVLSPVNQVLYDYLTWYLPPEIPFYGETIPNLAHYDLADMGEPEPDGITAQFDIVQPTDAIALMATNSASRFERVGKVIYGRVGEPYEVIRQTDGAHGLPLLSFALPCYDLGRGVALHNQNGRVGWWLALGDLIHLLWYSGRLPEDVLPDAGDARPAEFPLDEPVGIPDDLAIPYVTQLNIRWVLQQAGVPEPRAGVVRLPDDMAAFVFGPVPTEEHRWAVETRIRWLLPNGHRAFGLVDEPGLLPYLLP